MATERPHAPLRVASILAHAAAARVPDGSGSQRGIAFSTTYLRLPSGEFPGGRVYGRDDNPTLHAVESVLAALEGGEDAAVFASGMAAVTSIFLSLDPGTRVVVPTVLYYGIESWLLEHGSRHGLRVARCDFADPHELDRLLGDGGPAVVWLETPGNPFLNVVDIATIAAVAHRRGARVIVDGTTAPPVLTQALALGADYVVHSATKYLGGHSDLLGGAVVARSCDALWARVLDHRYAAGNQLGAFDAWLLARSLATLDVRLDRISGTALALARALAANPRVTRVHYPGLETHPGHRLAARQMSGKFGGLLSFEVAGAERDAVAFVAALRLIKRATSFGGVQTSIEHHATVRDLYGSRTSIPRTLLRMSVGLESVGDLLDDIDRAVRQVYGT